MEAKIGVVIHTSLVSSVFSAADRARLNALGEVRWTESEEPLEESAAIELLRGCTIGVGSWHTPWPSAPLVEACLDLRLWEHVAGTVTRFFGPHLEGRDLTIASCKTAIADNVADVTLAQLIMGIRRLQENGEHNRLGRTPKPSGVKVMCEATVGVVGASDVGRRVIRLLRGLNCAVLLYDPYVDDEEAARLGVEKVGDLVQLCARSDAVTLHTPNLPATRHLMGAAQLRAMPDDGIFVNTARGACVDEAALVAELQQGRLFAYLDVTDPEPAADDSPLRSLPNVLLTSHMAGGPGTNLGNQAVDDIAAFLRGEQPLAVVTADMLDRLG